MYQFFDQSIYNQMFQSATTGPAKNAVIFFKQHFNNNGTIHHPQLGNLMDFVTHVESVWDYSEKGQNIVTGLIRFNLGIPYPANSFN